MSADPPRWRLVEAYFHDDATYTVTYIGEPAVLIALGVAVPAMFERATSGRQRYTPDGYKFRRRPANKSGAVYLVLIGLPIAVAESLPGVPRTCRRVVWPLLEISDELRAAFVIESQEASRAGM